MKTDEEIDLSFLTDERSEDPCEHADHSVMRYGRHSGPGVWLVKTHARCHVDMRFQLLCDTYKRDTIDSDAPFACAECRDGRIHYTREWYTVVGKKGVDF